MSPIITPDQLRLVLFFTKPCGDHYLLWKFTCPNYCWQVFVCETNLWSNLDTLVFFRDSLSGGESSDFRIFNRMVPILTHFFKCVEFLLAFHKVQFVYKLVIILLKHGLYWQFTNLEFTQWQVQHIRNHLHNAFHSILKSQMWLLVNWTQV